MRYAPDSQPDCSSAAHAPGARFGRGRAACARPPSGSSPIVMRRERRAAARPVHRASRIFPRRRRRCWPGSNASFWWKRGHPSHSSVIPVSKQSSAPRLRLHVLASEGQDGAAALEQLADELGAPPAEIVSRRAPNSPTGRADHRRHRRSNRWRASARGRDRLRRGGILQRSDLAASRRRRHARSSAGNRRIDRPRLAGGCGAALACPFRKVVAIEADGSAMYTLQALWTMARERLDVTVVILANRRYRILDIEMQRTGAGACGPRAEEMIDLTDPERLDQTVARIRRRGRARHHGQRIHPRIPRRHRAARTPADRSGARRVRPVVAGVTPVRARAGLVATRRGFGSRRSARCPRGEFIREFGAAMGQPGPRLIEAVLDVCGPS